MLQSLIVYIRTQLTDSQFPEARPGRTGYQITQDPQFGLAVRVTISLASIQSVPVFTAWYEQYQLTCLLYDWLADDEYLTCVPVFYPDSNTPAYIRCSWKEDSPTPPTTPQFEPSTEIFV